LLLQGMRALHMSERSAVATGLASDPLRPASLPHRAAKLNFPEEAGGAAAQGQPASAPPRELGRGPGGGAAGGEGAGWVCGGVRLLLCVGQGVGVPLTYPDNTATPLSLAAS
jgi:hypothetical protein